MLFCASGSQPSLVSFVTLISSEADCETIRVVEILFGKVGEARPLGFGQPGRGRSVVPINSAYRFTSAAKAPSSSPLSRYASFGMISG